MNNTATNKRKIINDLVHGRLTLAGEIFAGRYPKKFLHHLVAGQLDMDRMDYLKRDSFYTGVTEGVIGSDRIIKMLNVLNDQLVFEAKGVYSVEKFLIARRLMYWQVYYHKTVVAAECLLTMLLKRARQLALSGEEIFATPSLLFFMMNEPVAGEDLMQPGSEAAKRVVSNFVNLDDDDITSAAKVWYGHKDRILSLLSGWFTGRTLFRTEFSASVFSEARKRKLKKEVCRTYDLPDGTADYFVSAGEILNYAYKFEDEKISILYNSVELADISEASDMLNVSVLSKTVKKYFLCFPKEIEPCYF